MTKLRMNIQNYRSLLDVEFETKGLSLFVGPNGSGKSTIFQAIQWIHDLRTRGVQHAYEVDGGTFGLLHWASAENEFPRFDIAVDEVEFSVGLHPARIECVYESMRIGEELLFGANRALPAKAYPQEVRNALVHSAFESSFFNRIEAYLHPEDSRTIGFLSTVAGFSYFKTYRIDELRRQGSLDTGNMSVEPEGRNTFLVLRNWLASKHDRHRYDFVLHHMRRAFSPVFDDMAFQSVAQTVQAEFYARSQQQPYYARQAAEGMLMGLVHLTAIASVMDGGIAAIDDPENGLHPDALRVILEAAEQWCEDHDATILLASQSTRVLDFFSGKEDRVFVMRPKVTRDDTEPQLVRLDEEFDTEWLRHFSLGDLYGKDFGVQVPHPELHDAGE